MKRVAPSRVVAPSADTLLCTLQRRGHDRRPLQVCAGTVSSNDFKNGMTLEIDGAPFRVVGAPPSQSSQGGGAVSAFPRDL